MGRFKIGLQLFSFNNAMESDFVGTLQKVKEMGYDGVEFAGLFGKSAKEIRSICEKIGLVPISAHVALDEMIENSEVLEIYAEIGCQYVVLPYLMEEYRPGMSKFAETIKKIEILGQKAADLGMKLCYHNHDFEFEKINGDYVLDIIYKEISNEFLETEFDTCWINVGGENPSEYILKYGDRTSIIHLKDFVGCRSKNTYALIDTNEKKKEATGEFEFRPVGYGVQNFEDILDAAEKVKANWLVIEQDSPSLGKTAAECAKMSIDYINKIN